MKSVLFYLNDFFCFRVLCYLFVLSCGNSPEDYSSGVLQYALIWWEQLLRDCEEDEEPPITTWEEMMHGMRIRFVSKHYQGDLFDKL